MDSTMFVPARCSWSATASPRSSADTITARSPGFSDHSSTSLAHGRRQVDADEVVAGEHQRLFERSRCHDDPLGAEAVEDAACVDGDETAFVDPDRPCRGEHLEVVVLSGEAALVDEHHLPARGRGGPGRLTPRAAAADHEHLRSAMLGVEPARAAHVLVQPPEAGDIPEDLLVHRPQAPRADHRAVVEADRRERAAEVIDGGE